MTSVFNSLELGRLTLQNRIVMAPLTRSRAGRNGVPTQLHETYYSQRASFGLVVTEGVFPTVTRRAFPGQTGIDTPEQIAGWRRVADAVHEAGGRIFMQVMNAGRLSHASLQEGTQPVAPSAVASGTAVRDFESRKDCPVPRALDTDELPGIIDEFRHAARNAIDAGMDGVEIHGANGYLLHEFLSPNSNLREDAYGGSPEKRFRLVEEIVRAVADEIGADRVGIRLSPQNNIQGIEEVDAADVVATYGGLLDATADLGLAYVSFMHAEPAGEVMTDLIGRARANGRTRVILNHGFGHLTDREAAERLVQHGDAAVVGRLAISNPDLVRRWKEGLPVTAPDESTFYTGGEKGYTDYPVYTAETHA
ncbi:alkene reductase [Corynebacterium sp. zg912]|uniref:Alkene reductase n=1 Tax=Corynebacterium wankanglinii TaxID=2735136 RepID=A0A7H0K9P3_9CORY|nr:MULTISPECIES: alkene reductase [Corynebacterium]MBA1837926.1 alkene reductase [Corynebacterium wankanglinii]MCR5929300.1 alkene reductase [Corynebacterium sp. zg912]QNP94009.1 alkene reductase [Corynebacterium wankanglinii]